MIIIDFLIEQKDNILAGIIAGALLLLILKLIKLTLKHQKPIMSFVGEIVKFSYIWIIPFIFIATIYLDPKYNLQEKHIFAIGFCGLAITFGYLYKLAESIDDNQ